VDPLFQSYPWLTTYQFASNRPIVAIDLDGLEADDVSGEIKEPNVDKQKKAYKADAPGMPLAPIAAPTLWESAKAIAAQGLRWYGRFTVLSLTLLSGDDSPNQHRSREIRTLRKYTLNPPQTEAEKTDYFNLQQKYKFSRDGDIVDVQPTDKYNNGKFGSPLRENEAQIRLDLNIPDNWESKLNNNDPGIRFVDPENPKGNHVRVSPGVYGADHPSSRVVNVKWYKNGSPMNAEGERIISPTGTNQNRTPEGHIPYEDFKYKE
jgi:hypothetical protein